MQLVPLQRGAHVRVGVPAEARVPGAARGDVSQPARLHLLPAPPLHLRDAQGAQASAHSKELYKLNSVVTHTLALKSAWFQPLKRVVSTLEPIK